MVSVMLAVEIGDKSNIRGDTVSDESILHVKKGTKNKKLTGLARLKSKPGSIVSLSVCGSNNILYCFVSWS